MAKKRPARTMPKSRNGARVHQQGWAKWLAIATLVLAALLIGVGGGVFLARQGDAGPPVPETQQTAASQPPTTSRVPVTLQIQLASVSLLPGKVRAAPTIVQQAYQFAIANPEILSQVPCFCGCGSMGHKSNLDCFIQRFNSDGSIVFDDHALG